MDWGAAMGAFSQDAQNHRNLSYNLYQNSQQWGRDKEMFGMQLNADNTAVQRRVLDLQRAGLNPMLAIAGMGAAAAPTTSGHGMIKGEDGSVAPGVAGAQAGLASAHSASVRGLLDSQKANLDADSEAKLASSGQAKAQADAIRATIPKIEAEIHHLYSEVNVNIEKKLLGMRDVILKDLDINQLKALQPYLLQLMQNDAYRSSLGLPRAKNMSEVEESWWGRVRAYIPGFGESASSAAGSAIGTAAGAMLRRGIPY